MAFQFEITVPKKVAVARLFLDDDDRNLKPPAADSPDWKSVKKETPTTRNKCELHWIKGENGYIGKAFLCIIPGFCTAEWVDRDVDKFIDGVEYWMPLEITRHKRS